MQAQVEVQKLKDFSKNSKKLALIQLVIGIVLILLPNVLPGAIMVSFGVIFIIAGGLFLVVTLTSNRDMLAWYSFILPIAAIALGAYTLLNPHNVISIIAWVFGVGNIIKGISTILGVGSQVHTKIHRIFGIVSIAIGFFIILASGKAGAIFSYYLAFSLIFHAIIDLIIARDVGKIIKTANGDGVVIIEKNDEPTIK